MISVIIPQKGHRDLTQATVAALRDFHGIRPQIIVVDDARDNTPIDGAWVIPNSGEGVTSAWNTGVQCASYNNVLLLNNDVVVASGFLESLASTLRAHERLIVGAALRRESSIGAAAELLPHGEDSKWIEGWLMGFSKKLWSELGGFDESMSIYFSDLAFQVDAINHGAGITAGSYPVRHLGHKTAHDADQLPDRSGRWKADRERFIERLCDQCDRP
jgi:GT2 family glycosyltransferase